MHRTSIAALLPHGLHSNKSWLRKAEIREITGNDELFLYEMSNSSAFERSVKLLERITSFDNMIEIENSHLISRLTIGDIIALILQIRQMMFGEYASCIIPCPNCSVEMSIELKISNLLQPPLDEPKDSYDVKVENFILKLQPITNDIIKKIKEDYSQKDFAERITRSCVIKSTPQLAEKIDPDLLDKISVKLVEIDPQSDLLFDLKCPNCKYIFQIPFFPEDFFFREFDALQQQFEMEVHWLAFNYHWSEDNILSLAMNKRKRYVEMINKTLSGDSTL